MAVRRVLVAVVALLMVVGGTAVASASPDLEAQFVTLMNQSRAQAGLAPLIVSSDLVAGARKHTAAMIPTGTIFHSTAAELGSVTTGWLVMGENVGKGPNPTVLHDAFMQSPSHRANILGDFDHVGVGVDLDDGGKLYVTVMFMKSASAPSTTTTTAPAPSTTTTTVAATTTTTVAPAPAPAPSRPSATTGDRDPEPRTLGLEVFQSVRWVPGTWCVSVRPEGSICVV